MPKRSVQMPLLIDNDKIKLQTKREAMEKQMREREASRARKLAQQNWSFHLGDYVTSHGLNAFSEDTHFVSAPELYVNYRAYRALVLEILDKSGDREFLQYAASKLTGPYIEFFLSEYRDLFFTLYYAAPRALFYLVLNKLIYIFFLEQRDVAQRLGLSDLMRLLRQAKISADELTHALNHVNLPPFPSAVVNGPLCALMHLLKQRSFPDRNEIFDFKAKIEGILYQIECDERAMHNVFMSLVTDEEKVRALFGSKVKRFCVKDPLFENKWHALEDIHQPCLMLNIGEQVEVRPNNGKPRVYKGDDILKKCRIFQGLQFRKVAPKESDTHPNLNEVSLLYAYEIFYVAL